MPTATASPRARSCATLVAGRLDHLAAWWDGSNRGGPAASGRTSWPRVDRGPAACWVDPGAARRASRRRYSRNRLGPASPHPVGAARGMPAGGRAEVDGGGREREGLGVREHHRAHVMPLAGRENSDGERSTDRVRPAPGGVGVRRERAGRAPGGEGPQPRRAGRGGARGRVRGMAGDILYRAVSDETGTPELGNALENVTSSPVAPLIATVGRAGDALLSGKRGKDAREAIARALMSAVQSFRQCEKAFDMRTDAWRPSAVERHPRRTQRP